MNCKIVLSPEKTSYNPGDKVNGKLVVSHQKYLRYYGFEIVLEGRAAVKFKDENNFESNNVTLVKTSVCVYGNRDEILRLQPTEHVFPFTLYIPETSLPGSFKSPYGLVLYQIVAYRIYTNYKLVKQAETITVNGYLNLGGIEQVSSPLILEKTEKSFLPNFCGRRKSNFNFLLRLPQSGYLPGEEVPFMLHLDNPDSHEIRNMCVALVQKITYYGEIAWKTTNMVVAYEESSSQDSNYGTVWTSSLHIPASQNPTLNNGLIQLQYVLQVDINTTGDVMPLQGEIPIIIGTVRNKRAVDTIQAQSQSLVSSNGKCIGAALVGPPNYSTLFLRTSTSSIETLPPSYAESVLVKKKKKVVLEKRC